MNSYGMEYNDCELEPKKQKQKRILPQWLINSKKNKNKSPSTEKIACAKPKKEKKNEKVNMFKKMFENKMKLNEKNDEKENKIREKKCQK